MKSRPIYSCKTTALGYGFAVLSLASCTKPLSDNGLYTFEEVQRVGMVNADWDDVDAAVEVGGSKSEMVVERVNNSGPDERVFALRTVAYEPVKLTVTRLPASAGLGSDGPRDIQMRCEVGRFGDRDREAKLMENVARRLIDLRGVDFAPIR